MGKSTHGRGDARLADMSLSPEKREYKPPPRHTLGGGDPQPIWVTDDDLVVLVSWTYRGLIVDFSIEQYRVDPGDGAKTKIARIDCCHGTIHRHQYDQNGQDVYDGRVILVIPPDDGWAIVDSGYDEAYDVMLNEWDANLRRWRGERS